jgi:hypothetical protein
VVSKYITRRYLAFRYVLFSVASRHSPPATRHYRPGFIRSSIGPWQHGQTCGNRTLIVQILQ